MNNSNRERSFKEERVRSISFIYYSRPEIKKVLYDFSINRETIPRYYEGFGKRPDILQYENDILEQVKNGATSFHSSEEIWSDPLEIVTGMSRKEFDEIRTGWDLLLDIDSPYLEYSKIYTKLLIDALRFHEIENFGVKFSGSKGFHIIIPWKAFPEKIYNKKTREMFPEWPRILCQYLSELIKPKLIEKIFSEYNIDELAKRTGIPKEELLIDECMSCNRPATKKRRKTWICEVCKGVELVKTDNKRTPKCPNEDCRRVLIEKSKKEFLLCEYCNFNELKNPEMFQESRAKSEVLIDADLILVAPRHLFRMPYSLHEKTALSSVVLDPDKIENFEITDAKPFKIEVKDFYLTPKIDEAKNLLLQALDWYDQKQKEKSDMKEKKDAIVPMNTKKSKKDFKKIEIPNPSLNLFPPQIKLLLQGVKQDGRKRALFILISFFKSLGVPDIELEKRIFEWNEKNYNPLKKGYITSQLNWTKRNPDRMPPNFSNPIYRELGVDKPDKLAMTTKNPVSYTIKKYFQSMH